MIWNPRLAALLMSQPASLITVVAVLTSTPEVCM
jgi:hypothetical protein